jgi:hypothetical protein
VRIMTGTYYYLRKAVKMEDQDRDVNETPLYGDPDHVSYWTIILGDDALDEYED